MGNNEEHQRITGSKTFQKQLKEIPRSNGRGRNPELLKLRNKAIVLRYYFYSEIKRTRFDDAIEACAEEFFLSSFTLLAILQKHDEVLSEAIKEKYTIADLKEIIPHFKF